MFKKYFLTGLAVLLPVALTLFIITFLIKLVTKPFVPIVASVLWYFDVFNPSFLLLPQYKAISIASTFIVLVGLFSVVLAIGYIGDHFLLRYFGYLGNYIFHRIPVVNKLYKPLQDMMTILFAKSKTSKFSRVVLVPFPHHGLRSIGFITQGEIPEGSTAEEGEDRISIFVPGTPNPAMGFMLLFKRDEIIPINMKVDDAVKFVISCGVICPEFDRNNVVDLKEQK